MLVWCLPKGKPGELREGQKLFSSNTTFYEGCPPGSAANLQIRAGLFSLSTVILTLQSANDPIANTSLSGAKVFASVYALFSGLVLIASMGFLLSPVAHRVMHSFHIDEEDVKKKSDSKTSKGERDLLAFTEMSGETELCLEAKPN